MAFDFPASPTNGQVFTPPGGPTYVWQSPRWLVQGSATAQTRNRIVNPAMQISQENGDTASAASAGTSYWAADQWQSAWAATGVNNRVARSANAVVTLGSKSVNHFNTVAKASLAAGDYCHAFLQKIEGVRMADFMWGTVSAKPVVLRFSVNSSIANHVFVVHLANGDSTRNYFKLCTFTATPGSWQDFILVIPGDTTGTWATDTAAGLQLIIGIAYGSTFIGGSEGSWQGGSFHSPAGLTNFFATASQSFQFANVGLYLDPQNTGVAPAWQMPDEAQELVACMRYFEVHGAFSNFFASQVTSGSSYYTGRPWMVPKRITPPAITGLNQAAGSFPATVGTLAGDALSFYETRVANATAPAGIFRTIVTGNARM